MAACDDTNIVYPIHIKNNDKINYGVCFILDDHIVICLDLINNLKNYEIYIVINDKKHECDIMRKVNEYNICFLKPKLNNLKGLFNGANHEKILMTTLIPDGTTHQCAITNIQSNNTKLTQSTLGEITFNKLFRQTAPYAPTYEFIVKNKSGDTKEYIGGLVHDENNKLIAMIVSKNIKTGVLLGIPIYVISSFLEKIHTSQFNGDAEIYTIFFEKFTIPTSLIHKQYNYGLKIVEINNNVPKLNKVKLNINDIIVSINNNNIVSDGWIECMNICMPISTYIMLQPEMTNIPIIFMRGKNIIKSTINLIMTLNDIVTLPLYGSLKENITIDSFGLEMTQLSEDLLKTYKKNNKNIVGITQKIFEEQINLNMDAYYVIKDLHIDLIESNSDLLQKYERYKFPMFNLCQSDNSYVLFLLTKINNKKIKKKLSEYEISSIHTLTFVTTDLSQTIKVSTK